MHIDLKPFPPPCCFVEISSVITSVYFCQRQTQQTVLREDAEFSQCGLNTSFERNKLYPPFSRVLLFQLYIYRDETATDLCRLVLHCGVKHQLMLTVTVKSLVRCSVNQKLTYIDLQIQIYLQIYNICDFFFINFSRLDLFLTVCFTCILESDRAVIFEPFLWKWLILLSKVTMDHRNYFLSIISMILFYY